MRKAVSNEISLFIPTLDSENTIGQCIKAVKLQSLMPCRIAVIDGGSNDITLKIAKRSRVDIIIQEGRGIADARNTAIKACKTQFIAFLDSDCIPKKNWLEKLASSLKKNNASGAGGRLAEQTEGISGKWRSLHLSQSFGNKSLINPPFLSGSNTLFRKDALAKCGMYNTKFKTNYEDVDISKKLISSGFTLVYEPGTSCTHMKRDTLFSIIPATRRYTFHSYPLPGGISSLAARVFIYNPHLFLKFLVDETKSLKLCLIPLNIAQLIYNNIYDTLYFLRIVMQKN